MLKVFKSEFQIKVFGFEETQFQYASLTTMRIEPIVKISGACFVSSPSAVKMFEARVLRDLPVRETPRKKDGKRLSFDLFEGDHQVVEVLDPGLHDSVGRVREVVHVSGAGRAHRSISRASGTARCVLPRSHSRQTNQSSVLCPRTVDHEQGLRARLHNLTSQQRKSTSSGTRSLKTGTLQLRDAR